MSDTESGYGEQFEELIKASGGRDIGIVRFEKRMLEKQEEVIHDSVGKKGYSYEGMEEAADELNDEWPHYNDYAQVTGRVYLAEIDLRDVLPSEWGEVAEDEEGNQYFYLENERLKSKGVVVIPYFDDESGMLVDTKVMHAFSYVHDDMEHPILQAQIGDLAIHQYELPTADEAWVRLERNWPKQAQTIERLVNPDLQMALPRRLALLARQLQEKMIESDTFRQYVELVLNQRASLDSDLPYSATIIRHINSFDGEDPEDPDDPGVWIEIDFSEELNTFLYNPKIFLSPYEDGSINAYILAQTYSDENGDDAEYVNIRAEDFQSFRSTRTIRSILSRALNGMHGTALLADNFSELEAFKEATANLDSSAGSYSVAVEGLSRRKHEPLLVRQMEMFQDELKVIAKIIQEAQKSLYGSIEQATDAAILLVNQEVGPKLVQSGIDHNFELEFSGSTAIRPQDAKSVPDLATHPHLIVFGVDSDEPFAAFEEGDSFKGRAKYVQALASQVTDLDGNAIGYKVFPSIIAAVSSRKESIVAWQNVSVVDLNIETGSIIPLDGSTAITIPQLDRYKDSMDELKKVSSEFKGTEVAWQLNELNRALLAEQYNSFQSLKRITLLTSLEDKIMDAKRSGRNSNVLVKALETILVGRVVGIVAEVYDRDGKIVEDSDGSIGGEIIDVRDDINDQIMLAVNEAGTVQYVSLQSITQFSF